MSRAILWAPAGLCLCACSLLVTIDDDLTSGVATSPDGGSPEAGTITSDAEAGAAAPVDAGACGPSDDPTLVAYYRLDETTGAAVSDCSGHGHTGQIMGTPAWTAGRIGGGLSFDGVSTCLDLGPVSELALGSGPITVTAWVNVTTFPQGTNGQYIFSETTSSATRGWRLATVQGEKFDTSIGQTSGAAASVATLGQPPATWLHVATTISTDARIYLSGRLIDTKVVSPIIVDSLAHTTIGCKTGSNYFAGVIDEVRVYRRVLSDAEIGTLSR